MLACVLGKRVLADQQGGGYVYARAASVGDSEEVVVCVEAVESDTGGAQGNDPEERLADIPGMLMLEDLPDLQHGRAGHH